LSLTREKPSNSSFFGQGKSHLPKLDVAGSNPVARFEFFASMKARSSGDETQGRA
jgi:hypothetical protein